MLKISKFLKTLISLYLCSIDSIANSELIKIDKNYLNLFKLRSLLPNFRK